MALRRLVLHVRLRFREQAEKLCWGPLQHSKTNIQQLPYYKGRPESLVRWRNSVDDKIPHGLLDIPIQYYLSS